MRRSSGERRRTLSLLIMVCVASFAALSDCRAEAISCPRVLPSTEQAMKSIPPGWGAVQTTVKHVLIGVRINLGDPRNGNDGAIYDLRTLKRGAAGEEVETLVWDVKGLNDPYLVCTYFGTSIALTRAVASFSRCEAMSVRGVSSSQFQIRLASCN